MGFHPCNDRKRMSKPTWLFCVGSGSLRTAGLYSYRGVCGVSYGAEAEFFRARCWVYNVPVMRHLTFPRIETSAACSTAGVDAGLTASHPSLYSSGCQGPCGQSTLGPRVSAQQQRLLHSTAPKDYFFDKKQSQTNLFSMKLSAVRRKLGDREEHFGLVRPVDWIISIPCQAAQLSHKPACWSMSFVISVECMSEGSGDPVEMLQWKEAGPTSFSKSQDCGWHKEWSSKLTELLQWGVVLISSDFPVTVGCALSWLHPSGWLHCLILV